MSEQSGRHAARHAAQQDGPSGLYERISAWLARAEATDPEAPDAQERMLLAATAAELRQELGRATAASVAEGAPVPGEHPGITAARSTRPARRQRPNHLKIVPGIAAAAFLRIGGGLRHAWVAHPVVTAAAGTVATAALVTTAAVVPHTSLGSALGVGATPASSAPSTGLWTASPVGSRSSSLRLAGLTGALTKPKLDAKAADGDGPSLAAPGVYYVPPAPSPSYSSSQQQAPADQQAPAGPAVLSLSTSGIDLSTLTQTTVTLTATGSGWISWKVDTTGSDLDFSAMHGVLQAGQSATLTVSLDVSQDGNLSQTFDVNGTQVTVTLPVPPPVVVPVTVPSPADTSLPVPVPSVSLPGT